MKEGHVTKLICLGSYRELIDNADYPSITSAIADSPQDNEDKIVAYLRNSVCIGGRGGYIPDVLDPSSRVPLSAHPYTDGTYFWTLDLAHYVEKYHLRLPPDFIAHMKSRNWRPPTEEQVDLSSLEDDDN
jgi:hypothetical protein